MGLSKYAEWVDLAPGECTCRKLIDVGNVVKTEIEPGCTKHEEFVCAICGNTGSESVVAHGLLGGPWHKPVRRS